MAGKLGKKAAVRPFGLHALSTYMLGKPPAPPTSAHYGGLVTVPFGMDGNGPDSLVTNQGPDFQGVGDCVMAEKDHALKVANAIVKVLLDEPVDELPTPTADEIVTEYFVLTGGQDTGLDIVSTLQVWQSTGLFGTKIAAYAPVNYQNLVELHQAVAFFGLCEIGINVQQAQMDQFDADQEWVWEPNSPVIGGHDVCITGYEPDGVWVATWGKLQKCSYQFLANAMDEAWVVLLPEFKAAQKAPKLDWTALEADLSQLNS